MRTFLYLLIGLLFFSTTHAQILFNENFNNYALGEVSTDFTGATPGKGGWYVRKVYPNNPAPCEIVAENGRGNVLSIGSNFSDFQVGNGSYLTQKGINTLWNSRTSGNNILKLEYDVYVVSSLSYVSQTLGFSTILDKPIFGNGMNNAFNGMPSNTKAHLQASHSIGQPTILPLGKNNTPEYDNFPYNSWLSVQLFIDYKYEVGAIVGGTFYVYIPALNILKAVKFNGSEDIALFTMSGGGNGDLPVVVKYDNIKLTALNTLPNYLGVEDYISQKFNLFPNPAVNTVNISNNENMQVQQIKVYDITGKQLSSHSYSNETQIQLNVENLASGTYMLHIQTNKGTAVKKLVKK